MHRYKRPSIIDGENFFKIIIIIIRRLFFQDLWSICL